MELLVTRIARSSPSPSLSDTLFGSCPAKATLPSPAAAEKPDKPVPTIPFTLSSETNRPKWTLDSDHKLNPDMTARGEAKAVHSILVVEDDPDITMALQDLLEFEGFHVDCVQTCRQAFLSIEQNAYHAILLDLGLPDGDGSSILEKLHVSHPSLPVIILTASNRDLGSLRAYASLTKPWDREKLCGILHHAINTASS